MGPCFISTEDDELATIINEIEDASMGPCFISTEDQPCGMPLASRPPASMGPCFISTEDVPLEFHRRHCCRSASMGPCFISTEDGSDGLVPKRLVAGFNGAVLHQHGRRMIRLDGCFRSKCFNGAVLHQHGRLRRQACPENRRSHASMGPCFISTEDAATFGIPCKVSPLQWGRASSARKTTGGTAAATITLARFNGAVLHQHGRRLILFQLRRDHVASMGPCFISTEDKVAFDTCYGYVLASMGPCFISTEDAMNLADSDPDGWLQWGRASSARKTRYALFQDDFVT